MATRSETRREALERPEFSGATHEMIGRWSHVKAPCGCEHSYLLPESAPPGADLAGSGGVTWICGDHTVYCPECGQDVCVCIYMNPAE